MLILDSPALSYAITSYRVYAPFKFLHTHTRSTTDNNTVMHFEVYSEGFDAYQNHELYRNRFLPAELLLRVLGF